MRRLAFILLLAAGCGRSKAAGELAAKLAELDRVARDMAPLEKQLRPMVKRFQEADKRGDAEEMAAIRREAEPLGKRHNALHEQAQALRKKIGDLAESALKKSPDDADVLEARVRLHADYPAGGGQGGADDGLDQLLADSEKLARLRPDDREAAARRACALRRSGRAAEARALLATGARTARASAEDGLAAYALDDYAAAVTALDEAARKADALPSAVATDVATTLESARERIPHWQKEQEFRGRDAGANVPQVKLVTSRGEITVELFEDDAPNAVANFVHLAESRFYDGTKFHHASPGGQVLGGDPNTKNDNPKDDGRGGPGWTIKDELEEGKYRRHFRGSLSMAIGAPDSGGSQFRLAMRSLEALDGRQTVFGRVLSGMDVVEKLTAGDVLQEAVVLRRRDHPYRPVAEK